MRAKTREEMFVEGILAKFDYPTVTCSKWSFEGGAPQPNITDLIGAFRYDLTRMNMNVSISDYIEFQKLIEMMVQTENEGVALFQKRDHDIAFAELLLSINQNLSRIADVLENKG